MHGLKNKILLLTLLPLFLILFFIGSLTLYNKYSTERQLLLERLSTYRTLLESGDLSFDSSQDKTKLEAMLNEKVEFAEILRQDYSVIYTTENSAAPLISDQEKKEVDEAFQGFETTKNIKKGGKSAFVIISPLIVNKKVVAVLHEALSNEKSSKRVIQYAVYILMFTTIGMVTCYLLISFLLNSVVIKNIDTLKQVTLEMQKGNMSIPVAVETDDEIGDFAKVFENMREGINNAKIKLEHYNRQLEDQVKERTGELQVKLDELEKINKLMVGRENRMTELKEKIQLLEKELAAYKTGSG